MKKRIQAACGTNTGKIRRNNEDNVCFGGCILAAEHDAASKQSAMRKKNGYARPLAVFDGMGGENFGELASYAAAKGLAATRMTWSDRIRPYDQYLQQLVMKLNRAVLDVKVEMMTTRMGTTMVSLSFAHKYAYVCNIGDSRAYCLREGELLQLSKDHVESRPRRPGGKPPLTQHLGIDPEDMLIDPYICKQKFRAGDMYLLCSDGLTDMLTDLEISGIMQDSADPAVCVDRLIEAALEHGGRDNITVIICRID